MHTTVLLAETCTRYQVWQGAHFQMGGHVLHEVHAHGPG